MNGWGEDGTLPQAPPNDVDFVNFTYVDFVNFTRKPDDMNSLWFPTAADRVQVVTEAEATASGLAS